MEREGRERTTEKGCRKERASLEDMKEGAKGKDAAKNIRAQFTCNFMTDSWHPTALGSISGWLLTVVDNSGRKVTGYSER